MLISKKKALGDVISFVLLTSLIFVSSLSAYYFGNDAIENVKIERDTQYMESFLLNIYPQLEGLKSYDNSQASFYFTFDTGRLVFNNASLYYQSLSDFEGSNICLNTGLCYLNNAGKQRLQINLSSDLNFNDNLSLSPGEYTMGFFYNATSSSIGIIFR